MSKGVPVIYFNSGATPELVQNNGIFVNQKQQLTSAIEEVQKIDRKKVFDYSKKFHVDEEIKTIINYYSKIK
jgi:glycosyltransferase involved in cell wall biosynthesis